MVPIGLLLIVVLVTACFVAGVVVEEYTTEGLPVKNQTTFCINECPNEDIGPLQVVFTGVVVEEYNAEGLPVKNQTTFCVNECPNEDIGPLQVVFTPGWNCTSSASGELTIIALRW
jgi:hypothetical protein